MLEGWSSWEMNFALARRLDREDNIKGHKDVRLPSVPIWFIRTLPPPDPGWFPWFVLFNRYLVYRTMSDGTDLFNLAQGHTG